jgi:hypothetical protein
MRVSVCATLLLGISVLTGCGNRPYPVEGQVVWKNDGSPAKELEGSLVTFENTAKGVSCVGSIQSDGSFRLTTTNPDDGAFAGDYLVSIQEHRKNADASGARLMPARLDERFRDLKESGLSATVKPGKNAVKLEVDRAK